MNPLKLLILMILPAVISTGIQAQNSQVMISNPVCPDSTSLSFGRPVDGNPSHFINEADQFLFHKGIASKSFSYTKPVYLILTGNQYCPKQRLILCPGDTIRINISGKGDLSFAGRNAAGLRELNEGQALVSGRVPIDKVYSLRTKEKVIHALEELKAEVFRPIEKLYAEHKLSDAFFDYTQKEADQIFTWAVKSAIGGAKYLSEKEKDGVKIYFFQKYDPYHPVYEGIHTAAQNKSNMAALTEKGVLPRKYYLDSGLWDKNDNFRNNLSLEVQEQLYADKLQIHHSIMGIMSEESFKAGIERLKAVSPNSVYLPALLKKTGNLMNSDHALGIFSYDDIHGLVRIGEFTSMDLKAMIKKYFKGTPVLVDMWATYCGPCKQEFKYKEELDTFLKNNGIKLLYCSIDYAGNSRKWADDVKGYRLYGTHYFITAHSSDYFQRLFGTLISIPKYLLFDREGNLVSDSLPRPSAKERMYEEIKQLLNK